MGWVSTSHLPSPPQQAILKLIVMWAVQLEEPDAILTIGRRDVFDRVGAGGG
jgi:hypothetical protein